MWKRGRGKVVEWVFGTSAQKWDPALVTTYKKGKDIRVIVWGAFWGDAAWDTLDDDFFIALVESIPRRIQVCIEAKGWHTKY
ncbi:transposase protein [Rutstroemia sp. NJR-2017a BVV2]|nr:transposase protein [Rutstroemia sp. NJR-2017a BVV2]